jgi:glycosyltransferase involved in cell wall biosynthesis
MRLALVIPALNEEEAIAGTLRRALAARAKVEAETPVEKMFVVFVNDGSTDRTQEIVDQAEFAEVVKVRFPHNRGYGAAIKAGWKATEAELVGFIDGDGTCDPDFCVPLLRRLFATGADVVLAGRLNPQSKMPLVRKLGNSLFARLLGLLSGRSLSDAASGFRIVRRSSLGLICPLPDRLHFTPAMSCVCLFDPRLRIEEVPMPYEERIGRSKLSVIRDGLRFLFTILFAAFFYTPVRMMALVSVVLAAVFAVLVFLLSAAQAPFLLRQAAVVVGGAGVLGSLLLGLVQHQIGLILLGPRRAPGGAERGLQALLGNEPLMAWGFASGLLSLAAFLILAWRAGGWAEAHPVVPILLAAVSVMGSLATLGGLLLRAVWMVGEKQRALQENEFGVVPPREDPHKP